VESVEVAPNEFWRNRPVFITGHTGFKGAWLSLWLATRGAKVHGFSLPAPTQPSFFEVCQVTEHLATHTIGDIRDRATLERSLQRANPEIILHLAAQPLVRASYDDPIFTFETNVIGTVNILELARKLKNIRAIVNVTTDKCYENLETTTPYKEQDALGGYDCYSASKACSEIVTSAYRRSFLRESGVCVASARAGNVIGGGDWSKDRLIPDFFRAAASGGALHIRYPDSVRPWQHVLEVLNGYTILAEKLATDGADFAEAWNFGPDASDCRTVGWIADTLCSITEGASWSGDQGPKPHEAGLLILDSSKAKQRLKWRPTWRIETALAKTSEWYRAHRRGEDMLRLSLDQIALFESNLTI
jgi:CDP-glucose 4,6-dehydratase